MHNWAALAVSLAALAAGIAYAIVRGLALYRHAKQVGGRLAAETDRIADVAAQAQEHLERADAKSAELEAALARLRVSRALLGLQLAAAREARGLLGRALPFLFVARR